MTKDVFSVKDTLSKLVQKYKHLTYLLIYLLLYLWFLQLEKIIRPIYNMYCALDSMIPFEPAFVVPYLLWFGYVGLAVAYYAFFSKEDYFKLLHFIYLSMAICLLIYMFFPNGQSLRVRFYEQDVFSQMVRDIQTNDTPTNVAPSMHVTFSLGVHMSLCHSKKLGRFIALRAGSFVMMVLICLSTVFIKQHSVLDGLYAIILSAVLYLLIYRRGL